MTGVKRFMEECSIAPDNYKESWRGESHRGTCVSCAIKDVDKKEIECFHG
jgi:hypothetical protein